MNRDDQGSRAPETRLPSTPATRSRRGISTGRRRFLARSVGVTAAGIAAASTARAAGEAFPAVPRWMQEPGAPLSGYGQRSKYEESKRYVGQPYGAIAPGTGASRTPLQDLEGTITPSSLHFERHHNGVPAIDPDRHRLLIHGRVSRPLVFTMQALYRYPMITRTCFIECSGNSAPNSTSLKPPQIAAGAIHGLVSCSEWSGVPLATLLAEAGISSGAEWLLAEGADAAAMSRSVPVAKALDDAMIALYQNGERLRPEQGYPVRLLLPGWEGNMSVKWLRRIKVTDGPTHTKDETSKYTDRTPDGKARQFTYEMGVKSVITRPSRGMTIPGPGAYEISGLAWSGAGRIRRVDMSLDGGASWSEAVLQEPILSKSLTRFRLPWRWDGARALLQSRAVDEKGNVQPARAAWVAQYAPQQPYHYHAIQTWAVESDGSVANVYL